MLVVTSGADAEDSAAERAVTERISQRDDLELASLARLAALAADADESSNAGEEAVLQAEARMAQAEEAFSRFDYSGATTQLNEALELLRPLARRATGRRRLAEAHLALAMVLHVHGEHDAALEEIRTCLHVDGECAPDPARHPPELVELYRAVREQTTPGGRLRVTTDPPGARATVNGTREARTPVEWDDVAPGRHYITLERDGFLPEVQIVTVATRTPTERHVAMNLGAPTTRASAALRALHARGVAAEERWRAQAATLTEADVLLVLGLGSGMTLGLFDARGAALTDAIEYEADDAGVARAYLDRALPPPDVPWYGQFWFWVPVSVGLTAAAAVLTAIFATDPNVRLVGGEVVHE